MAPLGSYSLHAHHPLLPAAVSAPPTFWMPRPGSTTSSSTEASAAATGAAVAAAAAAAASGRSFGPLPWMPPPGHPAWDSAAMAAAAAAAAATIAAARGSYTWSPSPPPPAAQHSWGARAAASRTAPEAPLAARASGGAGDGAGASTRSLPWLPPQPRRSWPPDLLAPGGLEPRGSSSQADGRSSLGRGSPSPSDLDLLLSDWEIDPDSVTIARRPDGTPWRLGSGGFGTVRQLAGPRARAAPRWRSGSALACPAVHRCWEGRDGLSLNGDWRHASSLVPLRCSRRLGMA